MIAKDIAVLSQRHPIRARIQQLAGCRLLESPADAYLLQSAFVSSPGAPALVIVDVLKLFSSRVTALPRLAPRVPNMIVVGLRDDLDALVAAWNEGIPADPVEDLSAEMLSWMAGGAGEGPDFYRYRGHYCAERVHSFLARRLESRVLTDREAEVAELIRRGWRYSDIAGYLDLEIQTVKNHASRIFDKLGVSNRHELSARVAIPAYSLCISLGHPTSR